LSLRVKLAHLHHAGVFLPSRSLKPPRSSQVVDSIGIKFDPYDTANLPRRILATGSACTFPSVVGLLGDVFNAPVLIPNSLVEQSTPDAQKLPSTARAALGAAYVARWGWRKTSRPDEKHASFEDEVRWLMTKKWTVAGNGPATSGGNRSRSVSAPGSAPGPGSYKHLHAKSGLAASSFAEEDEDEENYESSFGQYSGTVTPPRNSKNLPSTPGHLSTPGTNSSLGSMSGSSANITPNPAFEDTPGTPGSGHAPLAPIQPLPTDDADVQLGLVKVAEADHDTFLTYAAIVPEFCRLERMIVKGLV
jgi:xylulokinase